MKHAAPNLLAGERGIDPLRQDCELLTIFRTQLRVPTLRLGQHRIRVEVACGDEYFSDNCTRQVVLTSAGQELGRSRLRKLKSSRPHVLTVQLARPLGPGPPIDVAIEGTDSHRHKRHYVYRLIRP